MNENVAGVHVPDNLIEEIKSVAVIGGGTMGSQIAELLSNVGGYPVILWSRRDETVKRGLDGIEERLKFAGVVRATVVHDDTGAL